MPISLCIHASICIYFKTQFFFPLFILDGFKVFEIFFFGLVLEMKKKKENCFVSCALKIRCLVFACSLPIIFSSIPPVGILFYIFQRTVQSSHFRRLIGHAWLRTEKKITHRVNKPTTNHMSSLNSTYNTHTHTYICAHLES